MNFVYAYCIHSIRQAQMTKRIRIAIMDDHQGIIDGYLYRLGQVDDIEVTATASFGEELEPVLAKKAVDVLILDVHVPTSRENPNPYPILHLIPRLLELYPHLEILAVTMHAQRTLIQALMDAGVSGFVLKDDQAAIHELASVVRTVARGGIYLSPLAYQLLMRHPTGELSQPLSARQSQALSLCAAYPDANTADLAKMMKVAESTLRNLLSGSYLKLNVRTRAAAVAKARQMGLFSPDSPTISLQ
jgi:two-component system, NarL family, nitrate/nitrite response regulator NarL